MDPTRLNILKHMMPPQVIQYIQSKGDTLTIQYLLRVHFPWMSLSLATDDTKEAYIYLYKQAYLATLNKADPQYQQVYDSYLEPILLDKIGINFWLNDQIDYSSLYKYIKKDPSLVQNVMKGNFNALITTKAIQLNADYDDLDDIGSRGG